MKTGMNSRLLNKKGLTLIQTLIVVAIVVILFGVTIIGIQALVDRINQTKLDNVAQSIYVSAQNRISELKASGEIDRLLTTTELKTVANKPADWQEDTADTVKHSDLKYFYFDKDNPATSTSSDLVNFIFPKGSIDEGVLDDNWVIELDPVTGYVYSAFYSESRSSNDYYIKNTSTLDQSGTSSIRFKDFRHGLKGKNKIGYYGGKANMPADLGGDKLNVSLHVINADVLKAKMTAVIPSVIDTSVLGFKLTVKGKTSGETVTLTPPVSSEIVGPIKVFSASVILDKLEAGQHFKETFGSASWKPTAYVESRTGALIPGEDLDLSFTVSSSDDRVSDIGPVERTVNSLFESLNLTKPTEVNIAYGRHLQNLDRSTSGLPSTAVTSAKQISDIDFNDDSDKTLPAEELFRWKSLYGDKTFAPINNDNLITYSGYNPAPASESFKIRNMSIAGGTEPAGLFVNFAGHEISYVTMVNEKIEGGTNVGGLAGTTTADLTIKDCRLYVESDYFATGSTYTDNILIKGTSNVGGLVGSSTSGNILIKDSFASTIIEGMDSIGGLIGSQTSGIAQIQDSYADSYLIGGASTSKIGGLAGELTPESSISGSYSAGFAIIKSGLTGGKIAAAAGFVPNGISSVTNSYSIFNCSESMATDIYSTVPSATTVTNVYYFGSGDTKLDGSHEYTFTSNAEAVAGFAGSKFSGDNIKHDTYPYNQKAALDLVTYPYLSITGLSHYGDWEIPPIPEEPEFGRAGLLYWERVAGGSAPGYQIYLVGRKEGEAGNYEAVFHDTISVAHGDGGIVKEYGYGYYVAEKDKDKIVVDWENVNVPKNRNTRAESSFNKKSGFRNYVFTCYNTCNETNPATSYKATTNNYMFMKRNERYISVQNAMVTLTLGDEPDLVYNFCPFFAKSIQLTGWNSLSWNGTGTKPLLQYEPGTDNNPYRIRSLDQLQFINWNSLSRTTDRMTNDDKTSLFGPYYYKHFPYLHSTTRSGITVSAGNHWFYLGPLEGLSNFTELRKGQNFIQDYDIECIGRTGYSPIAALGETSGMLEADYRLPFFAWFGGSFDGQSYKIKNLSITSGCYSVGVFGLTVSSTIKNVILIGDSQDAAPVIKRPAGSPAGYYAIGTLVGMANDYSTGAYSRGVSPYDYEGKIENCTVAGYEVIDESDQPVYCGETTIGGLAGVLRTNIDRCSAVTTIRINTDRYRGTNVYGINYEDNITVGGIAGTNQTRIYNCYSGGRVIVDPSLIYTVPESKGVYKLNIYISGIASSGFTCRAVNMHADNDQSSAFISPKYFNCYSYMELPQPEGNLKVAVIGGDACYNENDFLPKQLGGELNNCHYYSKNYKDGQMIISNESGWVDNGIYSKSFDEMFQEQFLTDLNGDVSPGPYQKVTPGNYSFPCGAAELEGGDYPFAAVITQKYKNNSSDPDGIKYVHYGEWPIERRLELTNSEMELDLFSYHEDADGNIIGDFSDETEVKYYDNGTLKNVSLSNLEIEKDSVWVKFADHPTVTINDKVKVTASESEDGVCKLTVTGIDKTETEIIPLRYSVNDNYYSSELSVNITAVVNLSATPITTTVKTGEKANWNLILKDKNDKLIDSGYMEPSVNWAVTTDPSDVFSPVIMKAITSTSPFYLEAAALRPGEADFTVQALKVEVRDKTNKESDGSIRTFDSNELDLHALCYGGKLILKHHDGTEAYVENSYIYKNGDSGIDQNLLSDKEKAFSVLNAEMVDKVASFTPTPVFGGWYIKDETNGNHKKVLNPDGTIFTGEGDIAGFTQEGKFNVDPAEDKTLYAMWTVSPNLTFVEHSGPLDASDKKYLVIAKVPSVVEGNPEYYCMNGIANTWTNGTVAAIPIDLQHLQGNYYYLNTPVNSDTMLWEVASNKRYFKLSKTGTYTYLRDRNANAILSYKDVGVDTTKYDSDRHNLYFQANWRIVLNGTQSGFKFEQGGGSNFGKTDGGIWLFEYSTTTSERLHEFK
ncbi:MAG: pilus assembly FimT family protein [Saccharofermentanales bacterium]